MPASKKKPTTSTSEGSMSESSSALPEQEAFRQHLRHLAVSAVQVLLEQVMREELEQCLGASWGECTPTRRGYRNGSYTRDLVTPTGRIEKLEVPRDREGEFHSQSVSRNMLYTVGDSKLANIGSPIGLRFYQILVKRKEIGYA